MNKLFNFTDNVQCSQCKYCSYDKDDNSYYCNKKEMGIEAVEEFDECNIFELIYSQDTIKAIQKFEENLSFIPLDVHSIFKSINSEDKDTIYKVISVIDNIINYYADWVKNVKWEYFRERGDLCQLKKK